jgi:hypothetical protein
MPDEVGRGGAARAPFFARGRVMRSIAHIFVVLVCVWAFICVPARADDAVSFNRDIRPLLSDRCFACHGPHEAKRKGNLRLDIPDGEQGALRVRDGYHVIKQGDPDSSEVWSRLTTDDAAERMPPADSGKKPLTDAQKELIRRWILQGAPYEKFWAFVPPRSQTMPAVSNSNWLQGRIDGFVLASLDKRQIKPQPRADKRTLIRRVTLDLTGLPPTRAEIHEFEQDDAPEAYAKLVDRLLASPRYGEQMARHWLDLVRFADTNGMHHDHYRELSPYRDWVIRSFNANVPFDQLVADQLAGDLVDNPSVDQQIASGYNRLHMVMDKGTNPPQESYTRNVVDQVVAFGTVFLGMTLECAVCHDHKYDPVKQRDFYQLFAFFNNIDGDPETPGQNQQPPFMRLPTTEQDGRWQEVESRLAAVKSGIDEQKKTISGLEAEAKQGDATAADRAAALGVELKQQEEELGRLQSQRGELDRSIPLVLVMKERPDVRPAFILKRGAYDQPGEEVSRNTPAFLPPLEAKGNLKTRLDLARWVTDRRNPLTARVTVNRLWQQFFGVGLVKTSEDFGAQGEFPSHPELLDDLATTFTDSGWNVKSLVRSIVLSQAYQQSSRVTPAEFRADAENRLLARGSRIRLDSEVIRDQVLAISGLLNPAMFGKSVKPPQPADLWKTVSMVSSSTYSFKADAGEKIYRRSLYTFWKRAMPPPQMSIFDAPTRESCTSRRERTNTPVQALLMMNESQYFEAARHFAQQLLGTQNQNDEERLRVAYESVTAHLPDPAELAALRTGLESFRSLYREDAEAAGALTSDLKLADDAQRVELAAYTLIINSLFNLDVAKTRE